MKNTFSSTGILRPNRYFSRWDFLVIPLVLGLLWLLSVSLRGAEAPFSSATPDLTVNLNPLNLPYYALRSFTRMLIALVISLLFTFSYATLAAKNHQAEKILIPILDFLQSLPILGFLTITTTIFLTLFRGSMLGLEAVSIFAIFTSQAWNMAFSFYNSLKSVPTELKEVAQVMRLSGGQTFWRLEVPFALPSLVWNAMMSVSGGWFFVVASEVITVVGRSNPQSLPGIGSYVGLAISQANIPAMIYAAIALLLLVMLYDQLFFRPLVAWADKFKVELSVGETAPESWMLTLLRRSRLVARLSLALEDLADRLGRVSLGLRPNALYKRVPYSKRRGYLLERFFNLLIISGAGVLSYFLLSFAFGANLGFAKGQVLAANPNLNLLLDPSIAATWQKSGVPLGKNGEVWLSSVCETGLLARQKLATENPDFLAACSLNRTQAGKVSWLEVPEVLLLGVYTLLRVVILIVLAALIWIPIGVRIGLNPSLAQRVQPLIQFAAAFPSNLLFPVAVILIGRFHLNPEIWTAPLMVLGTQWYVLFNVVAGALSIPNDLKEAARVHGLRGWAWWRTLALPAIFPALVTGGITASGGSWNASIVAEVVSWGTVTLTATGLGAYIAHWSTGELNPHVTLGMLVMGLFVLGFNRLVWHPLFRLAEERFRL